MKIIKTCLAILFIGFWVTPTMFAVNSSFSPKEKLLRSEITQLYGVPFHTSKTFTVNDLMSLSPDEFSNSFELPMTWKQKLAYRMAQTEVSYKMSKGEYNLASMPSQTSGFSFIGFLLGFFLPLIGVLLAWIFWGRKGLISSLYGMLFSFILFIVGYRVHK